METLERSQRDIELLRGALRSIVSEKSQSIPGRRFTLDIDELESFLGMEDLHSDYEHTSASSSPTEDVEEASSMSMMHSFSDTVMRRITSFVSDERKTHSASWPPEKDKKKPGVNHEQEPSRIQCDRQLFVTNLSDKDLSSLEHSSHNECGPQENNDSRHEADHAVARMEKAEQGSIPGDGSVSRSESTRMGQAQKGASVSQKEIEFADFDELLKDAPLCKVRPTNELESEEKSTSLDEHELPKIQDLKMEEQQSYASHHNEEPLPSKEIPSSPNENTSPRKESPSSCKEVPSSGNEKVSSCSESPAFEKTCEPSDSSGKLPWMHDGRNVHRSRRTEYRMHVGTRHEHEREKRHEHEREKRHEHERKKRHEHERKKRHEHEREKRHEHEREKRHEHEREKRAKRKNDRAKKEREHRIQFKEEHLAILKERMDLLRHVEQQARRSMRIVPKHGDNTSAEPEEMRHSREYKNGAEDSDSLREDSDSAKRTGVESDEKEVGNGAEDSHGENTHPTDDDQGLDAEDLHCFDDELLWDAEMYIAAAARLGADSGYEGVASLRRVREARELEFKAAQALKNKQEMLRALGSGGTSPLLAQIRLDTKKYNTDDGQETRLGKGAYFGVKDLLREISLQDQVQVEGLDA